jgi:hypothetical protein
VKDKEKESSKDKKIEATVEEELANLRVMDLLTATLQRK